MNFTPFQCLVDSYGLPEIFVKVLKAFKVIFMRPFSTKFDHFRFKIDSFLRKLADFHPGNGPYWPPKMSYFAKKWPNFEKIGRFHRKMIFFGQKPPISALKWPFCAQKDSFPLKIDPQSKDSVDCHSETGPFGRKWSILAVKNRPKCEMGWVTLCQVLLYKLFWIAIK